MAQLGDVLLHVDALDAHAAAFAVHTHIEIAAGAEREVVLGYLVPFHQVRVGVVLAVELAVRCDAAVQRQPDHDDGADGLAVDDGQRAGQPETHRTYAGVGLGVLVVGGACAVHLAVGSQLRVHFEADDWFVLGHGASIIAQAVQRGRRAENGAVQFPHDQ